MHEAQLHTDNCFVTLTYDNEHLPETGSLDKRHFQLFMKRLRRSVEPKKVSFIHCGEYGDNLGRPHYHALIFGHDFTDKTRWIKRGEYQSFRSETLEKLWGMGLCELGTLTFQSAAYVARYCIKKVHGPEAVGYYQKINPSTGEIHDVLPEYLTCSTRPGIGKGWYEKFKTDIFPCDYMLVAGKKIKLPAYYEKLHKRDAADALKDVKKSRFKKAIKTLKNATPARLAVRKEVKLAQLKQLKREL